jgi:hypothetical protein
LVREERTMELLIAASVFLFMPVVILLGATLLAIFDEGENDE